MDSANGDHLLDVAREIAFQTLDDCDGDADQAARMLLLAAAELAHGIELYGRAAEVSTTLIAGMRTTLDDAAVAAGGGDGLV